MSFDHSMSLFAEVKEGVGKDQVLEALMPVLKIFDAKDGKSGDGCDFTFDEEGRKVFLDTYGDVGDSFDDALKSVASNLNGIVSGAGKLELRDHDTGDLDNAVIPMFFGPSEEAINAYRRKRDIDQALALMSDHVGEEKIETIRALIES